MKAKLNEINEKFENVVVLNNEEVACVTGGTNSTASGRLTVTTAPVASKAAALSAQ